MKYALDDFTATAAFDRSLRRKISDLKTKTGTKYAIHSTLITTYGVTKNAYANELQAVITTEELFM